MPKTSTPAKALATPVMILAVIGGVAGIGALIGLGPATLLAALTALFAMMAAFGGSLRADLRLLAGFAPALMVGAAAPRLLGGLSQWAAIALLTVVVFVASLLPALGRRYVTVGLGLGMASVFGYGFQLTGSVTVGQILGAPALALGVVVVLRVLAGLKDPGKPMREALADALVGAEPGAMENAARHWMSDRPERWTARVMGNVGRYRTAREVLTGRQDTLTPEAAAVVTGHLEAADAEAGHLGELLRAKEPASPVEVVPDREIPAGLPGDTHRWLGLLWEALDAVRHAAAHRDRSDADISPRTRWLALTFEARGALSWQSPLLRHAVRAALGMLVALAVATLRPGDPLTVSFLVTTFSIMQPEWRDSLSKAGQRVLGSLGGAVVLALVIWLLPPAALLPIALVALFAGFTVMTSLPTVFNGCMVLMAVGANAASRHLDPGAVLIEYVLLMLLAATIGLLFGFAAIPGVRKPGLPERFAIAIESTRELLLGVADLLRDRHAATPALGVGFRRAARAQQGLLTAEPGSVEPDATEAGAAEQAADALHGLHVSALAVALPARVSAELGDAIAKIAGALPPAAEPDPEGWAHARESLDEEQQLLLDTMLTDLLQLHRNKL